MKPVSVCYRIVWFVSYSACFVHCTRIVIIRCRCDTPSCYNRHSFRSKSRMIGTIARTSRRHPAIDQASSGPPSLFRPNSSVISATYAVIRQIWYIHTKCEYAISCTFFSQNDRWSAQMFLNNKTAELSQRRPRDAPNIWVPGKNSRVLTRKRLLFPKFNVMGFCSDRY